MGKVEIFGKLKHDVYTSAKYTMDIRNLIGSGVKSYTNFVFKLFLTSKHGQVCFKSITISKSIFNLMPNSTLN